MTMLSTTRTPRSGPPGVEERPRRGLLPRAALTAGAAAVVLGPALWAASPAGADTNPACPDASLSTATSCTYAYTGAEQDFTVPAGVTAVTITAVGAPGGGSSDGAAGGNGAVVKATVPLPDGTTTLYAEVGAPGHGGGSTTGGFNGGGGSGDGGTGGGASDVRTTSISQVPDSQLATAGDTRLVVAGGGGGAGLAFGCGMAGGAAGDSAVTGAGNGGAGTNLCGSSARQGGNGGWGSPAGTGGASALFPGTRGDGSLGQGGSTPTNNDPFNVGGGGGGGYYGGGAGGDGASNQGGGGGGGAGSSFSVAGQANTAMTEDTTGIPTSVEISWALPADLALTNTGAPNPVTSGQHLTYTLTAANTGGSDATGVTVTDPLPASAVFGSMHTTQGTCTRTVTTPNKNKNGTVTCHLGTLPGGGTATVTITVTPTTKGTLANTATITAGNISPADGDDSATARVSVHGT
jgi:uncharacterized repeat protein (TIGR01451 family)